MIKIEKESNCRGCEACASICPKNCIEMKADRDGFRFPVVNTEQCINCHRCEKVCPDCNRIRAMLGRKSKQVKVVKCFAKDVIIRESSSSGGIFSLFAEEIFKQGGVVFAVEKKTTTELEHVCIEQLDEIPKLRGSKYFQSHINGAYKGAKDKLTSGRKVLFVGTPCQVAALYSYLGKDYDNLVTCDLKCHGVPSPISFTKYCEAMERQEGRKVLDYYRDKSKGWNPVVFTTKMEDGELISKEAYKDEFNIAFIKSMNLRLSCYDCKFAFVPRMGDITLSDNFVDAHHSSPEDQFKGLSLLALNSEKGRAFFELTKDCMEYSIHEIKGRTLFGWISGCKTFSAYRKEFISRYSDEDFLKLINEFDTRPKKRIIKIGELNRKLNSEFNKYVQRYMH